MSESINKLYHLELIFFIFTTTIRYLVVLGIPTLQYRFPILDACSIAVWNVPGSVHWSSRKIYHLPNMNKVSKFIKTHFNFFILFSRPSSTSDLLIFLNFNEYGYLGFEIYQYFINSFRYDLEFFYILLWLWIFY